MLNGIGRVRARNEHLLRLVLVWSVVYPVFSHHISGGIPEASNITADFALYQLAVSGEHRGFPSFRAVKSAAEISGTAIGARLLLFNYHHLVVSSGCNGLQPLVNWAVLLN